MNIDMNKATDAAEEIVVKLRQTHGAENVNPLQQFAFSILRDGSIEADETGAYQVTMPNTGEVLMVEPNSCSCPQFASVRICQHTLAVRICAAVGTPPAEQPKQQQQPPARQQQNPPARQQQTTQQRQQQQRPPATRQQQQRQPVKTADAQSVIQSANQMVEPYMDQIRTLLPLQPGIPEGKVLARYKAGLVMYLSQKPDLAEADPLTLSDCLIKAAMQGFILGHDAYINVYSRKAVLIPEYRGLIRAAMNTGKVSRVWADTVCKNDKWYHDHFKQPPASHEPAPTDRGPILFYYAALVEKNGTVHIRTTSLKKISEIRDAVLSKIKDANDRKFSPWVKEEEPMGLKTAIKQLFKFTHLTPELSAIVDADDQREYGDLINATFDDTVNDLYGDQNVRQTIAAGDSV